MDEFVKIFIGAFITLAATWLAFFLFGSMTGFSLGFWGI
jgi:hypothetical protein